MKEATVALFVVLVILVFWQGIRIDSLNISQSWYDKKISHMIRDITKLETKVDKIGKLPMDTRTLSITPEFSIQYNLAPGTYENEIVNGKVHKALNAMLDAGAKEFGSTANNNIIINGAGVNDTTVE